MNPSTPRVLTWVVSSQKRVFEYDRPTEDFSGVSALRNEPVTFSLAFRGTGERDASGRLPDVPISVSVTCDSLPVSVYRVASVPLAASECEDGDPHGIGACPDILQPRTAQPRIVRTSQKIFPFYEQGESHTLNASSAATRSALITLNEDAKPVAAGEHTVTVQVTSLTTGERLATHTVTVRVIDALLPDPEFLYTNWIHYDCLADDSGLPLWSDAYFELLGAYVENAARHGMNTLLTPAFTPALDTPIGTERKNVQLVGVRRLGGEYTFDFSLLERFVRLAREKGIRYFEHAHLFSQWGAECAVNVYGETEESGGETVRLFGWDTLATDPEYVKFLKSYLGALLEWIDQMGIGDDWLFHLSDEPKEQDLAHYTHAHSVVRELLGDRRLGDALSDYAFYQHGLCGLPIVDTPFVDSYDGRCQRLMLYYTGGERVPNLSNRLLTNAPRRTRVLGLHLFRYRAQGFLHWGYNYTYGRMSQGHCNPATDPGFYRNLPGVTYLVYPNGARPPYPSIREKQMREALSDYRALKLLESRIGYDATLALCEGVLGRSVDIVTIPDSDGQMLALREAVNREIEKELSKERI